MRVDRLIAAAGRNVARRPLRNSLASLGVTLGTASLVALLGLAAGAEAGALERLERRPLLQLVQVFPGEARAGEAAPILDDTAVERLKSIRNVREVVPVITTTATLKLGSGSPSGSVLGMSPARAPYALMAGRPPTAGEADAIVLLPTVLRSFGMRAEDAIGRAVTFELRRGEQRREIPLRVVGVAEDELPGAIAIVPLALAEDAVAWIVSGDDQAARDLRLAQQVAASLLLGGRAVQADLAGSRYTSIWLFAEGAADLPAIVQEVEDAGYTGYAQAAAAKAVAELFGFVRAVLAAIAVVALAVAALGVANALLTSVSERTVEIGVLKAIGADDATVERLFLAEAAFLGVLGALAGIVIGSVGAVATALVVQRMTGFDLFPVIDLELVALAITVAIGVSLLAGWLPARRAARLAPADALRAE